MKTVQEYLRHAHECEELARKVTDLEQRRIIAGMAETWRILAAKRQRQVESGATD